MLGVFSRQEINLIRIKMPTPPTGRPRGRPKGALGQRSKELMATTKAMGMSPLEVMLWAMHRFKDADNHAEAARVASMAAPYVHARLTSVQQVQQVTVRVISSDDMIGEVKPTHEAVIGLASEAFVQ